MEPSDTTTQANELARATGWHLCDVEPEMVVFVSVRRFIYLHPDDVSALVMALAGIERWKPSGMRDGE